MTRNLSVFKLNSYIGHTVGKNLRSCFIHYSDNEMKSSEIQTPDEARLKLGKAYYGKDSHELPEYMQSKILSKVSDYTDKIDPLHARARQLRVDYLS